MSEMTQFLLAQSLIIVMAIGGSHIAIKIQLAKLEEKFNGLHADNVAARNSRKVLYEQINGISKNLAHLSGEVKSRLRGKGNTG